MAELADQNTIACSLFQAVVIGLNVRVLSNVNNGFCCLSFALIVCCLTYFFSFAIFCLPRRGNNDTFRRQAVDSSTVLVSTIAYVVVHFLTFLLNTTHYRHWQCSQRII